MAAYESVQTVSQTGAGLTQIGGTISGKTKETNKAADAMIVSASILGTAALAATKGNLDAASKAGASEGTVTASAWNDGGYRYEYLTDCAKAASCSNSETANSA